MTDTRCSLCGRSFASEDSKNMPFCSERCWQLDLARWLGESYGLPVESAESEAEVEGADGDFEL